MRKVVHLMLLASAAASPALAAPGDWDARQQARAERSQAREQRDSRVDRSDANRPERVERADRPQRVERALEASPNMRAAGRADMRDLQAVRDAPRDAMTAARNLRQEQRRQAIAPSVQRGDAVFRDRMEQRRQEARDRIAARGQVGRPMISTTPRRGAQPAPPSVQRPTPAVRWSSNWRHDNRYDWYNHRRHHQSLFNLGFYFDPFGWGYQRYNIGWRMWPSYYQSQYWLNNPWQYRLPYAPAGYRWVRYWDDAVLVDTWSGQVVDVIYNFFW